MSEVSPTSYRVNLGPLEVSPLGVGAWSWGDDFYWGKGDENDQKKAFDASLESGINFFDTAEVYAIGESERRCGRFKRSYLRRKEVGEEGMVLATKFGPLLPFRFSADSVVEACKRSAERMGEDCIDLYQLHWPGLGLDERYWDGIAKCYEQGLIKAVGVSNYGPKRLLVVHKRMQERGVPLVSNQILYNLAYRRPEEELAELCKSLDIKILAYSPLAQGLLTGKYAEGNLPSGPRHGSIRSMLANGSELLTVLRGVAENRDRTMAQVALNWVMCKGMIPIPGAKTKAQAEENAGALGWSLDESEIRALDDASDVTGTIMRGLPMYEEIMVPK
ncbi:hypothetical protein NDN08_001203 [Rhodosorus marinus]|uniref:NADP-dependent oxidoreductase domain-containing protein n=1 Tax=Rhodosorus marinus TaxID=101924 RepID=A0AAV8UQ37_9RHOD|nr:hypothetical protein NDN08_001203 [Rhodosorus marinus]